MNDKVSMFHQHFLVQFSHPLLGNLDTEVIGHVLVLLAQSTLGINTLLQILDNVLRQEDLTKHHKH